MPLTSSRAGLSRLLLMTILGLSVLLSSAAAARAAEPPSAAKSSAAAKSAKSAASAAAAALEQLKPPFPPPAAQSSAARAQAAATGSCAAQILNREGELVTLRYKTYKYKYRKIKKGRNKGKFKRGIISLKRAIKVSCAKQCVAVVKKRGKYRNVYRIRTVKRKRVKRGRIRTVKLRARVYRYTDCANLPNAESLGTPVKIEILPGSFALLDFGSFTRQASIGGNLRGFLPGKFKPNTDLQLTLTKGAVTVGTTPVFIDDDCNGQVSTSLRTGTPTRVLIDSTKQSTSTLLASGTATAIVNVRIQLPLELRNEDTGCNDPYITTGYSEFTHTFFFRGKVGPRGLVALQVSSPVDTLNVVACLSPGTPTQPCNGFQVPIPILISVKVTVKIDLSGKA